MITAITLGMLAAQGGNWDCGSEAHAAAAREAVEAANAEAVAALQGGDIEGYAEHFAEDAVQYPPGTTPYEGRAAIAAGWAEAVAAGEWDLSLDVLDLDVCGPLAVERGAYALRFAPGEGVAMPGFSDEGHYLAKWRLDEDGVWRIAADAPVSSQSPMPGAP